MVFLRGCSLPDAWAGQQQWRVLETGFNSGLHFLATWQAWRADPARPVLLHFVSTQTQIASQAELLLSARGFPALEPLAMQLAGQWHGLLPGTHRMVFEGGRVLLTLGVGDTQTWLRTQSLCVDSIFLNASDREQTSDSEDFWDSRESHTLKAVARCCHRGTQLASLSLAPGLVESLQKHGFTVSKTGSDSHTEEGLRAVFNPPWEPRRKIESAWPKPRQPQRCVVIGAGLAGAAAAASLARRGWLVTVLDANNTPAGGASSLPAGFLAPHVSPDDGVLSRLSRSGLRATWQALTELLKPDDFQASGVLQRRLDASARLPDDWPAAGAHWSVEADGEQFPDDAQAPLWHAAGGWVKPARLVQALLQTPGVTWQGAASVQSLKQPKLTEPVWHVLDAAGTCLAEAELVVLAAGPASAALVAGMSARGGSPFTTPFPTPFQAPLQPVRGQVLWGPHPSAALVNDFASALPTHPVNGLGGLIPGFSGDGSNTDSPPRPHWLMGATFERDEFSPLVREEDTQVLIDRLARLWPSAERAVLAGFAAGQVQSWAGVRCVSPDRLPLVGPLDDSKAPGIWLCTAMGSRGLTFAVLCGELLAAWLHAEPLPVEKRLAQRLLASRFSEKTQTS